MDRSDIIELICNLIFDNPSQKSNATIILSDLTRGKISVDQAIDQYNLLLKNKSGYWIDKLKPKVVYEALKKYQKKEQSLLDTSKMISSLITHAIIELQSNPQVTQYDLGIPDLIEMLKVSLSEQIPEEFFPQFDKILRNYGYIEGGEGE